RMKLLASSPIPWAIPMAPVIKRARSSNTELCVCMWTDPFGLLRTPAEAAVHAANRLNLFRACNDRRSHPVPSLQPGGAYHSRVRLLRPLRGPLPSALVCAGLYRGPRAGLALDGLAHPARSSLDAGQARAQRAASR